MMPEEFKILLVDEDPDLVKVLAIVLRRHGCTVKTALSGSEALRVFARQSFEVIIIELTMSGMSGIKLINRIRAIQPAQKIIAISVRPKRCRFWDSTRIPMPFEGGILDAPDIDCLKKPFKIKHLFELIDKIREPESECNEGIPDNTSRWRKIRMLLD
ncbi:response regulator [candidate division WOR-3 bacterium]|uniref:Response regulator n=1 Tax=candidate division WOR-3 bacterium TaxID=2052148 RepID=A0A9D5KCM9_UNCW3|nr:response regulator [candidate division WOR-3 bacterium]MBD3365650.1 response regulator [candidate division WOR-3 bacterium]